MLFNLTGLSSEPIYSQISRQLLEKILVDDFYDGSELPSARALAREQHVSVNTIERAYQTLECQGVISRKNELRFFIPNFTAEQKEVMRHKLLSSQSPLEIIQELSRIERELNAARQIQANLLPEALPANSEFSMAAYSNPSRTVGGDFYDCIPIDDCRLNLVIADACGKGLAAAMLISQIQAMIKSEINNRNNIEGVLGNLNQQLVRFTPKNRFVTLVFGAFDKITKEFEYSTAGHNYPVVVRKNRQWELLQTGGPCLGIMDNAQFKTGKIKLHSGDMLFLYTDGVTETMNAAQEEYGEQRLWNLLIRAHRLDPQGIIDAVLEELQNFSNLASIQDDRTILVLKVMK